MKKVLVIGLSGKSLFFELPYFPRIGETITSLIQRLIENTFEEESASTLVATTVTQKLSLTKEDNLP